jgi:hypothetical protein
MELSLQDTGRSNGVTETWPEDDEYLQMVMALSLQDSGPSNAVTETRPDDDENLRMALETSLRDSGRTNRVATTRPDDDNYLRMALELSLQDAGSSNRDNVRSSNSGHRTYNEPNHARGANDPSELDSRENQLITALRMQPELLQQLPLLLPATGIRRLQDHPQLVAVVNEIAAQSLQGYSSARSGGVILPDDNIPSPHNNRRSTAHEHSRNNQNRDHSPRRSSPGRRSRGHGSSSSNSQPNTTTRSRDERRGLDQRDRRAPRNPSHTYWKW